MSDVILCSGWLHKKRREARIGPKYQKRWFELTDGALAYAKDPNEVSATKIEVFDLWEMAWIKRVDQLKLQMKFPKRMLIVKAESPGETEKWFLEIESITKASKQPAAAAPESLPAPSPKKSPQVTTAFTIEADSDSDGEQRSSRPKRNSKAARKLILEDDIPTQVPTGAQRLAALKLTPPTDATAHPTGRPPSPRSLLANPKLGSQIVSTPTASMPAEESEVLAFQHSIGEQQDVQAHLSPKKKDKAPAADTTEPADDVHPLELPRPAIFNTSLRSTVAIQDEVAPTLTQPSSSSGGSPLNGSLRSSLHANGSVNSPLNGSLRGTASPLNSSLRGPSSSLNNSLKGGVVVAGGRHGSSPRPTANPAEEGVIAFEPHEAQQVRSSRPQSMQASRAGTDSGMQASRHGSAHTLHRPQDERLELEQVPVPSPRSHASRLGSAGSEHGQASRTAGRTASAASSTVLGVTGLQARAADQAKGEDGSHGAWDSSSEEEEEPRRGGQHWEGSTNVQAVQHQSKQQGPQHMAQPPSSQQQQQLQHLQQQQQQQQQQEAQPALTSLAAKPSAPAAPTSLPSAPPGARPAVRKVVASRVVRAAPKAATPAAAPMPAAASSVAPADVMGNSWDDETDDGGNSPMAHRIAAQRSQQGGQPKAAVAAARSMVTAAAVPQGVKPAGVQQDGNWVEEDWDESD